MPAAPLDSHPGVRHGRRPIHHSEWHDQLSGVRRLPFSDSRRYGGGIIAIHTRLNLVRLVRKKFRGWLGNAVFNIHYDRVEGRRLAHCWAG